MVRYNKFSKYTKDRDGIGSLDIAANGYSASSKKVPLNCRDIPTGVDGVGGIKVWATNGFTAEATSVSRASANGRLVVNIKAYSAAATEVGATHAAFTVYCEASAK